ncbi:Uma2 family endonuclease [Pseudanabaena catenata USMAC16]|uniref:Uma2 family endonuclease n=1 Tax=Pseudanabaena catenata USMAC16 TaxID=1855837 RepID=A0A9X4MCP0_9CYAN|nr:MULTISPECIES: Uma2 family endonuclease [Pseudanabaena]MDG3496672.1 Uma2 family endonuclease [Pseudanabaena catenata USMAC16]
MPCRVLPFLTTDTDWQDGHDGLDGLDSDIALICNNHLDIFPHPFLFRTTWIWNNRFKLGKVFDSSTCFKLPNNANRSPDVSWISLERWNALTDSQREKFPPITPDFVLELMSPTDTRKETQAKMQEYIENGARLGWLLDRRKNIVEIYRPNQAVEVLNNPDVLYGEDILPEFSLDLRSL